jgi:hypothetical protein
LLLEKKSISLRSEVVQCLSLDESLGLYIEIATSSKKPSENYKTLITIYTRLFIFNILKPFAIAFPIPPGRADAFRKFAKAIMTEHKKEYAAAEKRLKVTKESWFLQSSPQGDLMIDYIEAANPEKAMSDSAKAKDEFSIWYREEAKAKLGVDMDKPTEGLAPELLLSYGY